MPLYQQASHLVTQTQTCQDIPETFKGLGLSQQLAFCPPKCDTCWYITTPFSFWQERLEKFSPGGDIPSGYEVQMKFASDNGTGPSVAHWMAVYPSMGEISESYTYSDSAWGDLLTNYNGTAISYDSIGNPTNWVDISSLSWEGRELDSITIANSHTVDYTYNSDGIRTRKYEFNGNGQYLYDHNYVLDGSTIVKETVRYSSALNGESTTTLEYYYDESGIASLRYNGTIYYYIKNLQGDVIGILDNSGEAVVEYTYDAWGNILSVTGSLASAVGQANPFRYRGYYYDTETGLYYLNSRYYDPQVGRWINADNTAFLGADGTPLSYNLFAYCKNNPVMGYDPTGHFGLMGAIIATGAIVGGLLGAFSAATTGGNVLEGAIEGCLTGALGAVCGLSFTNPLVAGIIAGAGGAIIDLGTQVATQYLTTQTVDVKKTDPWRAVKVGLQTGIGAAIPAFGNAKVNAVDAFGTALIWAEASTLIVCTDIVVTNTIAAVQSSSSTASRNRRSVAIH